MNRLRSDGESCTWSVSILCDDCDRLTISVLLNGCCRFLFNLEIFGLGLHLGNCCSVIQFFHGEELASTARSDCSRMGNGCLSARHDLSLVEINDIHHVLIHVI